MTKTNPLEEMDLSYWQTDNKEWIIERHAQWAKIEPMFVESIEKSKRARGILKRYFIKGELPDFKELRDWRPLEGHLDLFCFIWLHPSWDEQVLKPLRDLYLTIPWLDSDNIDVGFGLLQYFARSLPCQVPDDDMPGVDMTAYVAVAQHNEVLFNVLMANIDEGTYQLAKTTRKFHLLDYSILAPQSKWLALERLEPINTYMMFQYDLPLEWWYNSFKNNRELLRQLKKPEVKIQMYRYFYRLNDFDIEKEGDTCRSLFVNKIRKILDEREFFPEFKQMWLDIKAGKIELEEPWNLKWKPAKKRPRLP